jgi:2-polyprenyl-6-methoxyphenol hydroxylase-like FAD-dependent oxidoreductase
VTRIAVSGGSIAGLGAGVALHRAGLDVHVFERDTGPLRSVGAGLVVQQELSDLLHSADGPELPVTRCSARRYLGFNGEFGALQRMPQRFTSWEAIYATLFQSMPPERYHTGATVGAAEPSGTGLSIDVAGFGVVQADVLIAADGAQSSMRRALLPALESDYAGYVAWRGTVAEQDMPQDIIDMFDNTFTFSDARSGGHALAYFIPGDGLSVTRGERRMNWVWYVGATPAERDGLLVTRDGHQRHASLRRGMARQDVVDALPDLAFAELHPMFARLVQATPDPFLQTIVDLGVPRTVFDRTVLIGDAAFVVRPHTAGGAAKAARDAQSLADALSRAGPDIDAALRSFEREQLEYGRALLAYGIDLGRRWARL